MQSVLYMWCGYLLNWKKYYFILDDPYIYYCSEKGKQIQGTISLQLVNINVPIDNPVCFNIHTGMEVIYLKALSIEDKVLWVKKLTSIIRHRQKSRITSLKQEIGYKSRKQQALIRFQQYIKQLWISHAKLQGAIQNLSQKNMKGHSISNNRNILDEVRRSAASFKFKATEISKYVQEIGKYLKDEFNKNKYQFSKDSQDFEDFDADETQFLSFVQQRNDNDNRLVKRASMQKQQRRQKPIFQANDAARNQSKRKPFSFNSQQDLQRNQYQVSPISKMYVSQNPIKRLLLAQNQVFVKIANDIINKRERDSLPVKFTPQSKFPVLSTLTGAIGSNLTKVSFPVTINQPLSMLQRGCQQLFYTQLLKQADRQQDPIERMSHVVAFVVSMLSLNDGRLKKPFNPLLGETFVFDDKQRQFFYFGEQVSHHPPISAMYCRSQNFEYVANSSSDLSFTGKSLKLSSTNRCYVQLNLHGDKYWFNRPTVSINNILFGNVYIEIHGDIEITCDMFKTKAKITFNEKSWTKPQCSIEGKLFKSDQQKLSITGFWNKYVSTKDENGVQRVLWTKNHQLINDQYNFNKYTLQLNHIFQSIIKQIPPTDSRFRPDQKILEYRDVQLAAKEKHRLQQKQRKRKKQNELLQKQHNIVWFRLVKHENQDVYQFLNDKYESQRFKDDKWTESLDIYN